MYVCMYVYIHAYSMVFTHALSDPGIQLLNKITLQTPSIKASYDSYCASVDVMLNFTYRHYIGMKAFMNGY